jgi:hypothetical protein
MLHDVFIFLEEWQVTVLLTEPTTFDQVFSEIRSLAAFFTKLLFPDSCFQLFP